MLKIRLQRVGRKNIPAFRIVLTDSRNSTKSGRYKEILGSYDPVKNVKEVKADRVQYWISVGAQPTGTVHNFLVDKKVIAGKKINVLPKKKPVKKEEGTTVQIPAGKVETMPAASEDVKKEEPTKETEPAAAV